ncbi:Methylmalonate-semialdehyde dehydrogenase [acylating], mitochondrial [Sarracenia purpurea var. burkii]
MGAINHAIIMPDASVDATLDALIAAGFGSTGQRCMALSAAIFVGGSMPWEEELVERAKELKVNAGTELGADLGPIVTKEAKDGMCRLIQSGVESGARLILDGRNIVAIAKSSAFITVSTSPPLTLIGFVDTLQHVTRIEN